MNQSLTAASGADDVDLAAACTAIVDYLASSQGADGSFPTYRAFPAAVPSYVGATAFAHWFSFGECPFCTANIVYHLADIDVPGVAAIIRKGCASLARGMENGVARYVPAHAKPIDFPTDVDDTCLAALALERNGVASGVNLAMVFENITPGGDILTWLVPRPAPWYRRVRHRAERRWLRADKAVSDAAMRAYGTPAAVMALIDAEYRDSFEPGIAANVLLHCGITPRTRVLLARLIERIETAQMPPGYYASLSVAYFHVARLAVHRIDQLERVKPTILAHFAALQQADGMVETPFHTALAALSYMYFEAWEAPQLARAVDYLARHRMHTEGWLPWHYCNDLHGVFIDGGAELTATLYLEVLYRWHQRSVAGRANGINQGA
ncbi:hypothetical protein [Massilia sp. DWR3-1-1]|uniref:hypothetical protein n=1 Tax=Massilia sp. DWR3-1-1 TaxID=2804559 RepID=UPI003CF76C05